MSSSSSVSVAGRVPHPGLWLEGFCLVPVAGGALLAGGTAWHPDGIGARSEPSDVALFWDLATRDWRPLPPLPHGRQGHAAVVLPGGQVLLIGGQNQSDAELRTTLRWEPGAGGFEEGPPLLVARARPLAVRFEDGAVLVLGSSYEDDFERGTRAEVLWPGARAWESAGHAARIYHPGPVCVSGERLVIAGGRDNGSGFAIIEGQHFVPPLDSETEVWERGPRTWGRTGPLTGMRDEPSGVTLSDGRILVVGGWDRGTCLGSAEVWDSRTGEWTATGGLALSRSSFALTALPGGRAAVSGGLTGSHGETETVELWDPNHGTWSPGPPLRRGRAGHQLVKVSDGQFLVVGCTRDAAQSLETSWELWTPEAG